MTFLKKKRALYRKKCTMPTKKGGVCGTEFETSDRWARFCSRCKNSDLYKHTGIPDYLVDTAMAPSMAEEFDGDILLEIQPRPK